MSETVFVVLWLVCGLIGCVQIWVSDKWFDAGYYGELEWCPTPRAILFSLLGSIGGPPVLLAGTISILATGVHMTRRMDNWFTRPICKNKDTT